MISRSHTLDQGLPMVVWRVIRAQILLWKLLFLMVRLKPMRLLWKTFLFDNASVVAMVRSRRWHSTTCISFYVLSFDLRVIIAEFARPRMRVWLVWSLLYLLLLLMWGRKYWSAGPSRRCHHQVLGLHDISGHPASRWLVPIEAFYLLGGGCSIDLLFDDRLIFLQEHFILLIHHYLMLCHCIWWLLY